MKIFKINTIYQVAILVMTAIYGLSFTNPSNPPAAKTGAPFDSTCNQSSCHSSNNAAYNGTITLSGLPATIVANTVYTVTITGAVTAGSPVRAGFELVAVSTSASTNAGTLTTGTGTSTATTASRTYIRQNAYKTISGGMVSWTFTWKAPATVTGNNITFYSTMMLCNGDGGKSGDHEIFNVLALPFTTPPPTASIATQNVSCFGGSNGSLTANIASGTTPYTYIWNNTQTTQTISSLTAGTYTVTVTDAAGLTVTASATVAQPAMLAVTAAAANVLDCQTPAALVSASATGGTGNYTYLWSTGATTANIQVNLGGTYTVTVSDAAGCSSTASATVTTNNQTPVVAAAGGMLTCTITSLSLAATSSLTGVTWNWSGPNGFTSSVQNPTVTVPGTYTCVVQNTANGCTASASAMVTANTTPPVLTVTGNTITCASPSVPVSATSNIGNAAFLWSGPNMFSAASANINVAQTGDYICVATDPSNGCTATATVDVNQNTTAPEAIIATPEPLNCHAPTVQLNGTASTSGAQISYYWTTANGNIVSGGTTLTPVVNEPGTYYLTVINTLNGCMDTSQTIVFQSPAVLAQILSTANVSCFGEQNGAVTGAASGGVGNLSLLWSGGQTTAAITGLGAGTYQLTVTDTEGCTSTTSATIVQPAILLAGASTTPETANGANDGTASAVPTGGSSPYAFSWSNGATTSTIQNLSTGSYCVTVTDINGCTAVQCVTVNSFNCAINVQNSVQNVLCFGQNNGVASVVPNGGVLPYNYSWSNGGNTATISQLSAGVYSVTITDANNCVVNQQMVVNEPAALKSNLSGISHLACPEAQNGDATFAGEGGVTPYSWLWDNGQTTASATQLGIGTHTVTLTDANQCQTIATATILAFDTIAPVIACPSHLVICDGVSVNYQPPVPADNCLISNPAILVSGPAPGSTPVPGVYTSVWLATDNSGNIAQCSFTVTIAALPAVTAVVADITDTNPTGSINITPNGTGYAYQWMSNNQVIATTEDLSSVPAGDYHLVVTDNISCVTAYTFTVLNLVATNEPEAALGIRLHPNPVHERLFIEKDNGLVIVSGKILHAQGQLVRNITASEWSNGIDVQSLEPGVYFLEVVNGAGKSSVVGFVKG